MKKINIFFVLLMFLSFTIVLASCDNKSTAAEKIDCPSALTYEQLNSMSTFPSNTKATKYNNYTGEIVEYKASYTKIPCLGSAIALDDSNNRIVTPFSDSIFSLDLVSNSLAFDNQSSFMCTHNELGTSSYVYYSSSLPIILYVTKTAEKRLNFVDCYGRCIECMYFDSTFTLNNFEVKIVGGRKVAKISTSIKTFYFTFDPSTDEFYDNITYYNVNTASESDFGGSNSTRTYYDALKEYYNSKGKLICHYYIYKGMLDICDESKKYVCSISLASHGFSFDNIIYLDNAFAFYANEEYYKNINEKGSKPTYKCRYLEINLLDGSTYYNDDFKYYIESVSPLSDNNSLRTTNKSKLVNYYELNSLGEKSDILKAILVKDKLTFDDSSLSESISKVYYLADSKLLMLKNDDYYVVTKETRTLLNYVRDITFLNSGDIMFKGQDNSYYICNRNELESVATTIGNGYAYITKNKFDDTRLFCSYNKNNDTYTCNGKTILQDFIEYLDQGIFVTPNGVYIGNNQVLYTTEDEQVRSISLLLSTYKGFLYEVSLKDGTKKYIKTNGSISINQ